MGSTQVIVSEEQRVYEDALVRQHLPIVQNIVKEVGGRLPPHVARAELVSAGLEGLARAARTFDAGRTRSFEYYAIRRVRGAILDDLRRRDWAVRSLRPKARRLRAAVEQLTASLGRAPTVAEIADRAGLEAAEVTAVIDAIHRSVMVSLDALPEWTRDGQMVASHGRGADASVLDRERTAYLIGAVEALPPRLRRVIVGTFFEDLPTAELAAELHVTAGRISQMRGEALALLREGINSQLDPDLLPPAPVNIRRARRKAAYYAAVSSCARARRPLARAAAGKLKGPVPPADGFA